MRTAFAAAFASLFALRAFAAPSVTVNTTQVLADSALVVTTVKNTGTETVKLLNDPRSVLSTFETEKFTFSGSNGVPNFRGARVKYSPEAELQDNDPASFTVLAPGQSIVIEHDLSREFDFSRARTGDYEIKPLNTFTYVDNFGKLASFEAVINPAAFKLTETTLPERDFRPSGSSPTARQLQSAPQSIGCSGSQLTSIIEAVDAAEEYVKDSLRYLGFRTNGTRYQSWFGAPDADRFTTIKSHFQAIMGKSKATTYDCSCTKSNLYAYVYVDQPGIVYLCPRFWSTNMTGTNSKAGTLVHEQTHFSVNGGTSDYAHGPRGCRMLAKANPNTAAMNADSHEYFAENSSNES